MTFSYHNAASYCGYLLSIPVHFKINLKKIQNELWLILVHFQTTVATLFSPFFLFCHQSWEEHQTFFFSLYFGAHRMVGLKFLLWNISFEMHSYDTKLFIYRLNPPDRQKSLPPLLPPCPSGSANFQKLKEPDSKARKSLILSWCYSWFIPVE